MKLSTRRNVSGRVHAAVNAAMPPELDPAMARLYPPAYEDDPTVRLKREL